MDAEAFEWNFNNLFTTSKHGGVFQKHKISFKFLVNIPLCPLEGASVNEPAPVSLLYLGDVEISEDAALAELKSQVRLLPAPELSGNVASSSEILICSSISFSLNYSRF